MKKRYDKTLKMYLPNDVFDLTKKIFMFQPGRRNEVYRKCWRERIG